MRLVKAANSSPHAKIYNLSTDPSQPGWTVVSNSLPTPWFYASPLFYFGSGALDKFCLIFCFAVVALGLIFLRVKGALLFVPKQDNLGARRRAALHQRPATSTWWCSATSTWWCSRNGRTDLPRGSTERSPHCLGLFFRWAARWPVTTGRLLYFLLTGPPFGVSLSWHCSLLVAMSTLTQAPSATTLTPGTPAPSVI